MDRTTASIFVAVAVAVLWGIPYALIAVALDHGAEPLLIAWARVAIGAAVVLALAAARRELGGLMPYAGVLVLVAVCDVAAPFTALSYGEQHVSAALAGILVGATPLFVGLLAVGFDADERPGRRGWLGLALGFAGVAALLLIARAGATRAALTTYLAPVFAVVAGAVALWESIAPTAILGLALILAGSWLAS